MANVLGDLFQEIADAIRSKTGETNAMAPASFPAEILSIPIVINGGGVTETEGNLKIASGSFYVSDENNVRQTITHGLGEKPDFICVCAVGVRDYEITGKTFRLMSAWGINSRFTDAISKCAYSAHGFWIDESDGTFNETCWSAVEEKYGMDNLPYSYRNGSSPWIYTPDDATFEVGANSTFFFFPGMTYQWIALSGVGAKGEYAEEVGF